MKSSHNSIDSRAKKTRKQSPQRSHNMCHQSYAFKQYAPNLTANELFFHSVTKSSTTQILSKRTRTRRHPPAPPPRQLPPSSQLRAKLLPLPHPLLSPVSRKSGVQTNRNNLKPRSESTPQLPDPTDGNYHYVSAEITYCFVNP